MKRLTQAVRVLRVCCSVLAGAAALVPAGNAHGQTGGNVTWNGDGASALWSDADNWVGDQYPSNPTPGIIYFTNTAGVTGVLDADHQVGGVSFGKDGPPPPNVQNTINLNGYTLTVAGDIWRYEDWGFDWLKISNGTLQVGTDSIAADIDLATATTEQQLILNPNVVFDAYNLDTVAIGHQDWGPGSWGYLDLRGTEVTGGVLAVQNLRLYGKRDKLTAVYLNSSTTLSSIQIANELLIGHVHSGGYSYIGNPADGGKLPPNISVTIGEGPSARGLFWISRMTGSLSGSHTMNCSLTASGGGVFTAYVTELEVVRQQTASFGTAIGALDIGKMDACLIDATLITVGSDRYLTPAAGHNIQGTLTLCSGTVTAGVLEVGATLGVGWGRVTTSNTTVTATNTVTLNKTAEMTSHIDTTSSGLDITNPDAAALTIHSNATLTLAFEAPPATRPHDGLVWAGDHVAAVESLITEGKIVIDAAGLGKSVSVYYTAGATHIGLPPPQGTVFQFR